MPAQPEKTELEKKLEAELAARSAETGPLEREPATEVESDRPCMEMEEELRGAEEGEDEGDEDLPEMIPAVDVEGLMRERDELKDQLLRARAEFDNYRKRVARDAERERKRAAESLIRDLLPVVDNLELALQHADAEHPLAEGVSMVVRQFQDVLRRAGVEAIPAVGEPFDPTVHEAVMHAPSEEVAENNVAHEFQKGYRLGDYVLRPSKVAVSKGAPENTSAQETSAE